MELEKERALIFLQRKTIVHVSKISGIFYNGLILEVGEDYFVLHDKENGEQFILFKELKKPLEPYKNEYIY